ncbi:TPA: glycosyltransferase [Serratia marcescens]
MKYAALIVTYNRLEKLQLCWKATAALSFEHIVIVDNASSDGTEQWLAAQDDPRLRVIRTERNLGGLGDLKKGLSIYHLFCNQIGCSYLMMMHTLHQISWKILPA